MAPAVASLARRIEVDSVIIIPGYGMAVAQAQHPLFEVDQDPAGAQGPRMCASPFTPSQGALPGHMNVLLAEAKVPYDIVLEMDEINEDFPDRRTWRS